MSNILILAPATIVAIAASRGTGVSNLLTPSPKEVWTDSAAGTAANIDIDLGAVVAIDTVFLGFAIPPTAAAVWTITGGSASYTTSTLKASGALRAVDSAGQAPATSHAFWTGASASIRYLRLAVTQETGMTPISAGVAMAGAKFQPTYNQEWGAGSRVIDTGSATALPDGGFAVVEGARKRAYAWTFGDLTTAEVDLLDQLQGDRGETRPVLVVEDPAATTGQLRRIHYGKLTALRAFERRNPAQTRWEMSMEEWV